MTKHIRIYMPISLTEDRLKKYREIIIALNNDSPDEVRTAYTCS